VEDVVEVAFPPNVRDDQIDRIKSGAASKHGHGNGNGNEPCASLMERELA
jgi:hypothetical protein